MGCTLAGSLTNLIKGIKRNIGPDYLFVEPFELVVTREILTALAMGTRDVRYEIGPVIALVNALEFDDNWRERRQTLVNHMTGSRAVAVTHADEVDDARLWSVMDVVKANVDHEAVFPLSVPHGRGVETLIELVTG